MKTVYPIIIHQAADENGCRYVEIPDIDRGTQGTSIADCMEMARDALCVWAISEVDEGRIIPAPSDLSAITVPDGAVATLVDVDFDDYRKRLENRAVRKNCTIPSWLNEAAEKQGVNFSAVLQKALIERLGL